MSFTIDRFSVLTGSTNLFRMAVFLGLILVGSIELEATSVISFSFDSLCVRADRIIHVRCVDSQSYLDADQNRIVTKTRLSVLETVKGESANDLDLTLPGGIVEGRQLTVIGMPTFRVGEETVVFLSIPDEYGSPWPMGLGQGYYSVRIGAEGGRYVPLNTGVPLPEGVRSKPGISESQELPLQEFLTEVRRALSAERP